MNKHNNNNKFKKNNKNGNRKSNGNNNGNGNGNNNGNGYRNNNGNGNGNNNGNGYRNNNGNGYRNNNGNRNSNGNNNGYRNGKFNKYNRNKNGKFSKNNRYNKNVTKLKFSDLPLETHVKDLVDLFRYLNLNVGSINIKEYESKVAYVEFFDIDEAKYCVECLHHTPIDPYNMILSVNILDY